PNSINIWFKKGHLLFEQNDETNAILALNKALEIDHTFYQAYGVLAKIYSKLGKKFFEQYYVKLFQYYSPNEDVKDLKTICDLFFVNSNLALETALKNNILEQTVYIKATQICYYSGKEIINHPENLVRVPVDNFIDFFHTTMLRLPKAVEFDPASQEETLTALSIAKLFDDINVSRNDLGIQYFYANLERKPVYNPDEPLRFYLYASRRTVVMQYCSRNIVKALENNGCDVTLLIEDSDLEDVTTLQVLKSQYECNPHAVVSINHVNNKWLHPDVYNITWWQDFMPELENKKTTWRKRDIVLTADPALTPYLEKSGAKNVQRQEFCVDTTIFKNITPLAQRRKAIFIGISYKQRLTNKPGEAEALDMLQDTMDKGEPFTMDFLKHVAKKSGLELRYIFDLGPLLTYVVRDTAVKWLCELAPKLELEVEIYGRGWDEYPTIKPYFKGEVEHGPKVAALYNQAKYALSSSPYVVDSQRLSEIAACGVIPIMYDARPFAQKPHWDDECLWFNSQDEFNDCFTKSPKNSPAIIAETNSYDTFAKRIISWIKP
ncbi:MAG: hypothetical protein HQL69_12060, partial [Magnetococcales bacterium]|nr:hypothetical protein [Magnetococcales bacterium]